MKIQDISTEKNFIDYWTKVLKEGKVIQNRDLIEEFFSNQDHGFPHSLSVWRKAQEIINELPRDFLKIWLVNAGCALHDMGRIDPKEFELNSHHKIGVEYAVRWAVNYEPWIDTDGLINLFDLILNHDYFNPVVSEPEITRPKITEALLVRAADKMSLDPAKEVQRYWDYGKRKGGIFYKIGDDLHEEIFFRQQWTPKQYKDERTDQLCWLFLIFELQPKDFLPKNKAEMEHLEVHNLIFRHYYEWQINKRRAVEKILEIAEEECPKFKDRIALVITEYKKKKGFMW